MRPLKNQQWPINETTDKHGYTQIKSYLPKGPGDSSPKVQRTPREDALGIGGYLRGRKDEKSVCIRVYLWLKKQWKQQMA